MKILFDHQIFSTQRYGGISRYFVNLNTGLNQLPGVSSSIAAMYSENAYINNSDLPLNNPLGAKIFAGHQNRIYRWNRRYSSLKIKLSKFDVFHPTYYDPYFIDELKKPFVLTVHDMIHELMGKQFTDNNKVELWKKTLINRADAIIAISEYTKNELIKFYPETASKITVVHHGYQFDYNLPTEDIAVPGKYILFVGERHFYKNFIGFVRAIAPLLNDYKDLNLVCTAGGKFITEEKQLFADLNIGNQCQQTTATDMQLHRLYQQASVFVFPSFTEGFGFPLLEAFTAGCPVAASNNSCFPEIGGDAALYFDPYNDESIYSAVKSILNDGLLQTELIKKGRTQLKHFTLEKQMFSTNHLYQSLYT